MVVGGSSSARVHGVDRFYNPPAMRRQLLLQQQKLQEQPPAPGQQQKPVRPRTKAAAPLVEVREAENRAESDDSSLKPSVSCSSSSSSASASSSPLPLPPSPAGNLARFLESTSPSVTAQYFAKTSVRGRRNCDGADSCPYFNLGDLWESFAEWSAYGAGVPLVLNGSDSVVQYYVPYLSALQIYVDSSRTVFRSRCPGEESDGDIYQGTSSDGSEGDANRHSRQRRDCPADEGVLRNDAEISNQPERPIFEYLERDPPYGREPLADKISSLASRFPDLKTYKSCDLHPTSWISVAWYPIYRIPIGPTLRDLDACFLTFHLLATPVRGSSSRYNKDHPSSSARNSNSANGVSTKLHLPVFGLASYKFKGSIWTSDSHDERQQVTSLQEAADNWLRFLQVDHPDFRFFASHLR